MKGSQSKSDLETKQREDLSELLAKYRDSNQDQRLAVTSQINALLDSETIPMGFRGDT